MTETTASPAPATLGEAQQEAAAQLQAGAQVPMDAGPTLEQIQQAQREAVLPYETQLSDAMAAIAAMQAQLKDIQTGVAQANAAAGPPAIEQYASGVATLVKVHAAASPDLDPAVFAGAIKASNELTAAATDAVTSRDVSRVNELAAEIETWVSKFRAKPLDFSGLRADLELLAGAAEKLAG
jgi:hypothetical protein